mmetsp:Transcript_5695/g.23490  ORF Transcript_5695/g.23490 Transcript_5695/m.23490 type:complete len:389 (+) Transcript_5695:153-1319(+)
MPHRTAMGQGSRRSRGLQLLDRPHRRRRTDRGRAQDPSRLRRLPRRVPAVLRLLEEVRRRRGEARGNRRRGARVRARHPRVPLQHRPVDPTRVARHRDATRRGKSSRAVRERTRVRGHGLAGAPAVGYVHSLRAAQRLRVPRARLPFVRQGAAGSPEGARQVLGRVRRVRDKPEPVGGDTAGGTQSHRRGGGRDRAPWGDGDGHAGGVRCRSSRRVERRRRRRGGGCRGGGAGGGDGGCGGRRPAAASVPRRSIRGAPGDRRGEGDARTLRTGNQAPLLPRQAPRRRAAIELGHVPGRRGTRGRRLQRDPVIRAVPRPVRAVSAVLAQVRAVAGVGCGAGRRRRESRAATRGERVLQARRGGAFRARQVRGSRRRRRRRARRVRPRGG